MEDYWLDEEHHPLRRTCKLCFPQQSSTVTNNSSMLFPQLSLESLDDILDDIRKDIPLGLKLTKSVSFMNLIETRLEEEAQLQGEKKGHLELNEGSKNLTAGSGASCSNNEKFYASNFPASVLRIGTWEWVPKYKSDLVVKFYFRKHKLVWEVLNGGLKSKMEIQWSDIMDLKANFPKSGLGTLDVVLAKQPCFFEEIDPQPNKHTKWKPTGDFTGGQASIHRKHSVQCSSDLLCKNFEMLIQYDPHLKLLSEQPPLVLISPYFELKRPVFGTSQERSSRQETSSPSLMMNNYTHAIEENRSMSCVGQSDLGLLSRWDDQFQVPGIQPSISMSNAVVMSHMGRCTSYEHITSANPNPFFYEGSENMDILEEIQQHLLSDIQQYPLGASTENLVMSRVNSLCCLLQINPITVQSSQTNVEENVNEVGEHAQPMSPESCETMSVDLSPYVPEGEERKWGMSREDSLDELLFNIPRIASLPQLL